MVRPYYHSLLSTHGFNEEGDHKRQNMLLTRPADTGHTELTSQNNLELKFPYGKKKKTETAQTRLRWQ